MSVFDQVKQLVQVQGDVAPELIKLESSFTDDLGFDSLNLVELVLALEEKFDIKIPDEDAQNLRTVGDVVNYITSHS